MLPPQLVERPSITTRAGYFIEGRRRLGSAMEAYPELEPWGALIELHRQGRHIRGKSARKYYQEDRRILEASLRLAKRRELCAALHDQLVVVLDDRRRPRVPAYGAGKKVKDATEKEVIAAFREIKRNALATQYMIGVHAALFVLIAAHSAVRPVELIGAKIEGAILIVKNAKAKPGRVQAMGKIPGRGASSGVQEGGVETTTVLVQLSPYLNCDVEKGGTITAGNRQTGRPSVRGIGQALRWG